MATDEYKLSIKQILEDKSQSITDRFRALFILKNIGGKFAINSINSCFGDKSALLKHELAFCLGQMQDEYAIDFLIKVLEDERQEIIVRHEAGEALGAIGSELTLSFLKNQLNNPNREIRETCQLAIERINWIKNPDFQKHESNYGSIDPAPPLHLKALEELRDIYLSSCKSLFERYGALFTLRNIGSDEAVDIIIEGLTTTDGPLFKHEVAYVLGQIRNPRSIFALSNCLQDLNENSMVRHESAEALGSIASDECVALLSKFLSDEEEIVRESCQVGLDMLAYEQSSSQFEHFDGIKALNTNGC